MMLKDPYFDEEHDMLREQVRRFVENEIVPNGEAWEEDGSVPRALLHKMGDLGFLGLMHEEKYGGSGMDVRAATVLAEELARSTFAGVTITALVHTNMASPHLANAGSDAQKQKYLPDIISGRKMTAICVTEPAAGSDVAGIKTRAIKDGNDWVINGSKIFITNGVHGDIYFVAAKTDPSAKGSRGVSIFIVEKGTPGFSVGRSLKKHGWRSSDTAELYFDNVRVPQENLLGEENKGFYAIMQNFQHERIMLAAMGIGEAQKALDITIENVKNRSAFGATLWDKDVIRDKLARAQTKVTMARNFLYYVAWLDAQGVDCIKEVSMLKADACEFANQVMYDCLQLHGGMGFMQESTIERMYRDARVLTIGGGATEVMYGEVAKRM
ncbi:MAG: acyl-CoA dehydrogenase family protein [Ketobacteraceae bacterium]|nr:acyl-CoA dehydrogenase family protein [Ketobacteraceae bacterium]